MSLISYSQNFEDIMLWRALKDIKNGFYIDVGAHSPRDGSVTKTFYDNGWNGINIEPIQEVYSELLLNRPRDINLQLCVGSYDGTIDMYDIQPTGLGTTSPEIAEQYKQKGYEFDTIKMPIRTLLSIYNEYVDNEIHFLKIDVEGFEQEVLKGTNFSKIRPWIIVVEATYPNSSETVYNEWESILLESKYNFVYFDGLNRFYVSDEHKSLSKHFKVPPNYFDGFALDSTCFLCREVKYEVNLLEEKVKEYETILTATEAGAKAVKAEAKATEAEAEAKATEALYNYYSVVNSNSWKVTKPLRLMGKALRWFIRGSKAWIIFSPSSRPRRMIKEILLSLKEKINNHKVLKKVVTKLLKISPSLYTRLKNLKRPHGNTLNSSSIALSSQRSERILMDIKNAIQLRNDKCES